LKITTMTPVTGPYAGTANPIRTVPGGGLPWIITAGNGALNSDGHLLVHVRGLVLAGQAPVPPALQGTNPIPGFEAIVSCQTISATGAATITNVSTAPVPASTAGNSDINATVSLPHPCLAPIVSVLGPPNAGWFAATGGRAGDSPRARPRGQPHRRWPATHQPPRCQPPPSTGAGHDESPAGTPGPNSLPAERDRPPNHGRARSAVMRVGLDLQGCLQCSTEGLFCAQGSGLGGLSRGRPGVYSCRRTAVCVQGVRGSAPCARSGMPSGHAVWLGDSQEECVTRRSVLAVPWRTCYRWIA
jgi:hypothetical protein